MPNRGRHQQARLQKPDRRIENQSKIRSQQSLEPPVLAEDGSGNIASDFAYSAYGHQASQLSESADSMGFVSDDLKQLISMTESNRSYGNDSRDVSQQQYSGALTQSPMMSPESLYQRSPLPPHQGLYGPVMVPPPLMINHMAKPGPHPYQMMPGNQGVPPMFMPMGPMGAMPQMNHMHQNQVFPHQIANGVPMFPTSNMSGPPPMKQAQQAVTLRRTQQRVQEAGTEAGTERAVQGPANTVNEARPKQHKKKAQRKEVIPPQQVPVTFSTSPSASSPSSASSSSFSTDNNTSKSNRKSSHGKSDGHSKCYAGATFATEAPQVTTLPKPSFV